MNKNKDLRFKFGKNWQSFLKNLQQYQLVNARNSLISMLGQKDLKGKTFLDIGSGSGLFSLAAKKLGANVYSFDIDINSVKCTEQLKEKYYPNDNSWIIKEGDILKKNLLKKFDIVYAWGVLHHTGMLWAALEKTSALVNNHGQLFIAIYNDQGLLSKYWKSMKFLYNKNFIFRPIIILFHAPYLFLLRYIIRFLKGKLNMERGMSLWHDMLDWLGGYPFEVAKSKDIIDFFTQKGFVLIKVKTVGNKHGCNEYVFQNKT